MSPARPPTRLFRRRRSVVLSCKVGFGPSSGDASLDALATSAACALGTHCLSNRAVRDLINGILPDVRRPQPVVSPEIRDVALQLHKSDFDNSLGAGSTQDVSRSASTVQMKLLHRVAQARLAGPRAP
jgi:hypothetical protein